MRERCSVGGDEGVCLGRSILAAVLWLYFTSRDVGEFLRVATLPRFSDFGRFAMPGALRPVS
jgi:hypothetical protein